MFEVREHKFKGDEHIFQVREHMFKPLEYKIFLVIRKNISRGKLFSVPVCLIFWCGGAICYVYVAIWRGKC